MNNQKKYVLDTNIIVSALLFKSSQPRQALDKARTTGIILMSNSIWVEIQEVLARAKFDKYITPGERQLFLIGFHETVIFIDIEETINACRDSKDDKYLELAVNGQATIIISGDQDLLVLNPFKNIPIVTVRQFLEQE
ncbi:putative toxin-antitoxin system toxin component, PIN family [Fortiea sp. LEGE XX443]|uniref:putative toxin-antitoxin system toxin component, PIN family n=1 Tax=Fortiea sp. LEGE XX443 TaxID=1828611 RepID=UPI0018803556|nr:putative toxin-antitoxin system toxin component, PIN family [Fortiea sp. LEGE XX443]MBE9004267.1 putative toxin-antitoxin system toxin component, PIN family [Fortiea sp. LEGE XX443]